MLFVDLDDLAFAIPNTSDAIWKININRLEKGQTRNAMVKITIKLNLEIMIKTISDGKMSR